MKTVRIGRLDLKCRGIRPGVARGALQDLSSALSRQLSKNHSVSAQPPSAAIRAGDQSTPAGLADAVAERVAARIQARIAASGGRHPS